VFATGVCTATSFVGNGSGLTNLATDLVNDTSPQLGGDLDTNDFEILLDDNHAVKFGAGVDLDLRSNGTNGIVHSPTGHLRLQTTGSDKNVILENASTGEYYGIFKANGAAELYHDGTKQCETNSTGLAFPSGKGISFAATGDGSGTMTSELLDDYEEGTFNVTLPENGTGNQTVTNNPAGRYTKIGGFVYIYIYAIVSGSPQNNGSGWQIGGLPYAPGTSGFTHHGMGQIQYTETYNYDVWRPLVSSSSRIYFHRVDGSGAGLLNSDVASIGMTYFLMGASYMSVN